MGGEGGGGGVNEKCENATSGKNLNIQAWF